MTKMGQLSATTGKNIERSFKLVGTAAAGMAATIVASLTTAIAKGEDFAFTVSKMAQQTGTTTEMFSKLAYSAKQVGIPLDTLKGSLERLARTSGAAQSGNKEAIAAYGALGISVKDLNGPLKNSGDLLVASAKSLNQFGDSANKTALTQKILGRSGAELAPLLSQLATGFDTASAKATLFGVVIGDKTAAQAVKLHQSMTELESIALGFSLRLLSGVSPALQDVSAKLVKVATSADGMQTVSAIASNVATVIRDLGDAFFFLSQHTTAVKVAFEGISALQIGSILVPLVAGAAKAGTGLDTVGLAAVKMIGRLSGVSQVLPLISSVTSAVQVQAFMFRTLAQEEGTAVAATYALSTAWKSLTASMLANPGIVALGLLTAGAYVFQKALTDDVAASAKLSDAAVTFADYWKAAIDQTKDRMEELKTILFTFDESKRNAALSQWGEDPTFGERVHMEANTRLVAAKPAAPVPVTPKLNAPPIPKEAAERVDIVAKKLMELRDAAAAARQSLADAGKGVDFERADEAAKESKKTIDELNIALKAKGKALTVGQKAEIIADTATRINSESQAKYRSDLVQSTRMILAQVEAHRILTAAVGQGAQAVAQAQVDSESTLNNANQSPQWIKNNKALLDQQKAARLSELSAANTHTDASALDGLTQQLSVQKLINAAILAGRDATNQARLASEQAAIVNAYNGRGDHNDAARDAELAANEKLFNAKNKEADLTRAAGMDAARLYNDEAQSLQNAASAARDAGQAINEMQLKAANKANLDQYIASIEKVNLAVGGMSDGFSVFFEQMARGTESSAQQVHDLLGGAFEGLNGTLEKIVTTHTRTFYEFTRAVKQDFGEMLKGISSSLASLGLKNLESGLAGGLMKSLGIGSKADPTVGAINGTNQRLDVLIGLAGGKSATSAVSSAVSSAAGLGKSSGSWLGGAASSLLGLIPGGGFLSGLGSLFGGHRALGGDVQAGMSYDVGEMGRETFTPSVNGKITPNNKLGTGGNMISIDARGSNDPSQTEAAIHRAMKQYAPTIAAGSVKAQNESRARRPASGK